MSWQPIIFYYAHSLSGLTATSEASGYPVSNIIDRVDGTVWKATSTATQYITFDAGAGNTISPDYLLIHNHNLKTVGAAIVLQYSSDNFAADIVDAFAAFVPSSDKTILKTFAAVSGRYWRLKISGAAVVPFIGLCWWGTATTLDFADDITPFDEEIKANVNIGESGFVQGIHNKFTERQLDISFEGVDYTLWAKIQTWRDTVGLGLFGVAWEPGDHATDIWIVRRKDGKWDSALRNGGSYMNMKLKLIGRKE
jgi:hypothetical protein